MRLLEREGRDPFQFTKISHSLFHTTSVLFFKTKPAMHLLDLDGSSKAAQTAVNPSSGKSFTNGKKLVVSPVIIPTVFWSLGEEKSH